MAQVDFSNALYAIGTESGIKKTYAGTSGTFTDSSGNSVATISSSSLTQDQDKSFVRVTTGTFTANGTEFYFNDSGLCWRVYNINFNNGDTFSFQVSAELVTQ